MDGQAPDILDKLMTLLSSRPCRTLSREIYPGITGLRVKIDRLTYKKTLSSYQNIDLAYQNGYFLYKNLRTKYQTRSCEGRTMKRGRSKTKVQGQNAKT